jgi:hypothetical protein
MLNQPDVNARWIKEQYFSRMFGANGAKNALLPVGVNSNPMQRREAMIENALFGQGMQLPVDPADAHFEHVQEHLTPLGPIAAQYKQTNQVPDGSHITTLVIGLQHTAQHLEFLKADDTMKPQYQQVWPVFSQIQSITRGILAAVQKQQMEQRMSDPANAPQNQAA